MCRSKHVGPSLNFGIINSITKLHLVGISTESSTMDGSMNIKDGLIITGTLQKNRKCMYNNSGAFVLHPVHFSDGRTAEWTVPTMCVTVRNCTHIIENYCYH